MADMADSDQMIEQMNQELDLYIPADVTDEHEIYNYNLLFFFLRKLYYLLKSITKEEVTNYFSEYYHADESEKRVLINKIENRVDNEMYHERFSRNRKKEESIQRIDRMLEEMNSDLEKAKFLFILENGETPKENSDLEPYMEIIRQGNEERRQAKIDYQRTVEENNNINQQNYGAVLNPDDVANRYLN